MSAVIHAIPADRDLVKVADAPLDGGKGHRLHKKAAAAWFAMVAAARRDGVLLWPASGGAPCFRSLVTQRAMRTRPGDFGLNPSMTVSLAPVGSSTHQDGYRIDIGSVPPANDLNRFGTDGRKRRAWLLEHADEFGWFRADFWPTPERDHNHFTYDGKFVPPAPPKPKPAATETEDVMLPRIRITPDAETPVGPVFTHLPADDKGGLALATGPCRVDVAATVVARDMPAAALVEGPVVPAEVVGAVVRIQQGGVLQVRFVRATTAAGKTTIRSEGVGLELVGNTGSSFGQLLGFVDLAAGEELRLQAMSSTAQPVLVGFSASLRVQKV